MKYTSLATITASMLQQQIGTIMRRVAQQGETILVERDSVPAMILVPVGEYQALQQDQKRFDQLLQAKGQPDGSPTNASSIATTLS